MIYNDSIIISVAIGVSVGYSLILLGRLVIDVMAHSISVIFRPRTAKEFTEEITRWTVGIVIFFSLLLFTWVFFDILKNLVTFNP